MRSPSKKNSDKCWSRKKKKLKSKSAKRRRYPLISSYSSSESESRKKSSKSKKLEKKRKGSKSKKLDKKRNHKNRSCRDSCVSSSSSDSGKKCSTCSDSEERSRSPVRKSKLRKRDRKSFRIHESSRSRSRYRSPSCSTCSGSRSSSPSLIPIVDRLQTREGRSSIEKRSRSQSQSLVQERFQSSREQSPTEERNRSPTPSPFEDRFRSIHSCSVTGSPFEDRFRSSGRSSIDGRYRGEGERKRLKSVIGVVKTSGEDDDKIIKAYDDYPYSWSKEGYDKKDKERNLETGDKGKDSCEIHIDQPVKDSDVGDGLMKDYSMRKESEAVNEDGGKEVDELELILRQKALENLRKFRGAHPVEGESLSDKKDDSSKLASCQGSQNFVKPSESRPPSSLDNQRLVKRRADPNELKAISVVDMPIEKNDVNAVHNLSNESGDFKLVASSIISQKAPNNLKMMQVTSNNMPAKEASLVKDNHNNRAVAKTGSCEVSKAELGTADTQTFGVPNPENENCKSDEPKTESASGAQFEKKTFSRMRDGEMVQVSYKVYIPKKIPALARRQLQR